MRYFFYNTNTNAPEDTSVSCFLLRETMGGEYVEVGLTSGSWVNIQSGVKNAVW